MWRIRSVANMKDIDEPVLNNIRDQRAAVIQELEQIIRHRPSDEVKIQVSQILRSI